MTHIVIIGTLDTKGEEFNFARECVERLGAVPVVADFGVMGEPAFAADFSPAEVARLGGGELAEMRIAHEGSDTRAHALTIMTEGLRRLLAQLVNEDRCDAVLAMGGSGGSSVSSAAMRSLPVGLPKLLVSTMASGDVSGYVGESDLIIMHSVTDILGLNRISRAIVENAVGAVVGMAEQYQRRRSQTQLEAPSIGISMFGVTTPAVIRVSHALEADGFETVVFHAVGSGGRAMEALVDQGLLDGVIDLTTAELVDQEYGGKFAASADRMRAMVEQELPYLATPGATEVLNFGAVSSVPETYRDRDIIIHNTSVCAVRVTKDEAANLGRIFGTRLRGAHQRATVVVPMQGFSNYSKPPDGPWMDAEADAAFIAAMEPELDPDTPVIKVDANINDPEFADRVYSEFKKLWDARHPAHRAGVGQ